MLKVDYAFYTDEYGGGPIPAEAWPQYSRDAAAYVQAVTFGRASDGLPEPLRDACRMAVCAVAEVEFGQSQGGEVASATNDGYSETYVVSGKTPEQRRYGAVAHYLALTGLLYQGGGPPCCFAMRP